MKEIAAVLATANGPRAERLAAQRAFLQKRGEIWKDIQEGRFPVTYVSADYKKFVGVSTKDGYQMRLLVSQQDRAWSQVPQRSHS